MDPQEDLELTVLKFLKWGNLRLVKLNSWKAAEGTDLTPMCVLIEELRPKGTILPENQTMRGHYHFTAQVRTEDEVEWLTNQLKLRRYVFAFRNVAGPGSASLWCVTKWLPAEALTEFEVPDQPS